MGQTSVTLVELIREDEDSQFQLHINAVRSEAEKKERVLHFFSETYPCVISRKSWIKGTLAEIDPTSSHVPEIVVCELGTQPYEGCFQKELTEMINYLNVDYLFPEVRFFRGESRDFPKTPQLSDDLLYQITHPHAIQRCYSLEVAYTQQDKSIVVGVFIPPQLPLVESVKKAMLDLSPTEVTPRFAPYGRYLYAFVTKVQSARDWEHRLEELGNVRVHTSWPKDIGTFELSMAKKYFE